MVESIFRYPAIISFLVRQLHERYPDKQIGKTLIQKMVYLLTRKGIVNFDYSMYHYGPYSAEAAAELNFAENNNIIKVKWVGGKGYFLEPTDESNKFDMLILDPEKQVIDKLVEEYGDFTAVDLSIIATAYFIMDNFEEPEASLVETIHNIKPKYSADYIKEVLQKGGLIPANPGL